MVIFSWLVYLVPKVQVKGSTPNQTDKGKRRKKKREKRHQRGKIESQAEGKGKSRETPRTLR